MGCRWIPGPGFGAGCRDGDRGEVVMLGPDTLPKEHWTLAQARRS